MDKVQTTVEGTCACICMYMCAVLHILILYYSQYNILYIYIYVAVQVSTNSSLSDMEARMEESLTTRNADLLKLLSDAYHPPAGSFLNPASSCKDIPTNSPSGKYWIQTKTGYATRLYCDMEQHALCSDSIGGWLKVADIDMTDPSQSCPAPFATLTSPRRLCGRTGQGCRSMTFRVPNIEYTKVCGRVKAYQANSPDGISSSNTIEDIYLDGISLTHGTPREHIWSFAAARHGLSNHCPCLSGSTSIPNSVVGQDYFCDTGSRHAISNDPSRIYDQDPLWDGEGCAGDSNTCCEFNHPPWFSKTLPGPTEDDIEFRICANGNPDWEDTPFEIVEIFVQ